MSDDGFIKYLHPSLDLGLHPETWFLLISREYDVTARFRLTENPSHECHPESRFRQVEVSRKCMFLHYHE